jgi:hypothetical protein
MEKDTRLNVPDNPGKVTTIAETVLMMKIGDNDDERYDTDKMKKAFKRLMWTSDDFIITVYKGTVIHKI